MLQLYHGSNTQFTHFKIFEDFKHGRDMGAGIYLTDSIERARAYGKLIYKVLFLPDINHNCRTISANTITLSVEEIIFLIELIAKKEEDLEGYPYILSNYGEPSEDNISDLASLLGKELIMNNKDDLSIISEIENLLGGLAYAGEYIYPALNELNIFYAIRKFMDYKNEISNEYLVFNPDMLRIVDTVNKENIFYEEKQHLIDGAFCF